MRPIKLMMQAFGPYAGSEVIDFSLLKNHTMFVISGKTGAGKTTIFDGISYAIYGKASGEDRNGPELRSQFASPNLLTEVSLEFKLKEKRYKITRSPQQEKKKERGDGYTAIGAKAELILYDDNGHEKVIASSIRDVEDKIKEIMQIDSNQFRQIVMIPQGEFRKMLISDSKEKEAILQRLFHTEMYKRVEEKLKEQAQTLKKTVEDQITLRNSRITNITSYFVEELADLLEQNSENDVLILPLLEKEIHAMQGKIEELMERLAEKNKGRDAIKELIFEADTLQKQLNLRDELQKRMVALEEKKVDYTMKEERVKLAQKASVLSHQEEICHHLKREIDRSITHQKELEASIAEKKEMLAHVEQEYEKVKEKLPERENLLAQLAYLNTIENKVQLYDQTEEAYQKAKKDVGIEEENEKRILLEKEKLDSKDVKLKDEKRGVEAKKNRYFENKEKQMNIKQFLERITDYDEVTIKLLPLQRKLQKKQEELLHTSKRYQDARQLVETFEERWLTGQSYLLAQSLKENDPCPVCGSIHHPNLASAKEDQSLISELDLKHAKADATSIEQEKQQIERTYMEIKSHIELLKEEKRKKAQAILAINANFPLDDIQIIKVTMESDLANLKKEQQQLKLYIEKYSNIEEDISKNEKSKQQLQTELDRTKEKIQSLFIAFTKIKTNLESLKESIPSDLRTMERFQQNRMEKKNVLSKLEAEEKIAENRVQEAKELYQQDFVRLQSVREHYHEQSEALEKERILFIEKMKKQGFETYKQYANAKLRDEEIDSLQTQIKMYQEEVRSINVRFHEINKTISDKKLPDIKELHQQLKEVEKEVENVQQAYTNMLMKIEENKKVCKQIKKINNEVKQLEEQYKLVGHLYDISRGQNTYRVTFERFVLGSFLDDILEEANHRLIKMTSGRYRLLRKMDRAKGNVQSGLELLVYDQYTGQQRHVKTLSGGESFKAALALALGLADVVQQYAGGVSLETMFIDEGFGTLDQESLEQAIETLVEIQDSGRLVGLISHVPELKERMEVHLEVCAAQEGSTTKFHFLSY